MRIKLATIIVGHEDLKNIAKYSNLTYLFNIAYFDGAGVIQILEDEIISPECQSNLIEFNIEVIDSLDSRSLYILTDSKSKAGWESVKSDEAFSFLADDFNRQGGVHEIPEWDGIEKFILKTLVGINLISLEDNTEVFQRLKSIYFVDQAINIAKQLDLEIYNVPSKDLAQYLFMMHIDENHTELSSEPVLAIRTETGNVLVIDGHHRIKAWQVNESIPIQIIPHEYTHLFTDSI